MAPDEFKFDVYALPFVPKIFRDVNEAPANIIHCAPVRWIDFDAYVQTFAGSNFLSGNAKPPAINAPPARSPDSATIANGLGHAQVTARNYHDFFTAALEDERAALQQECDDHALFRAHLLRASTASDPRPSMYILMVPGLREMSLRIEVGDVVQLRQLRFNNNNVIVSGPLIYDPHGRPIVVPRHADNQHNAVVWGIDRFNETLSLRVDDLHPRSMLFNVRFTVQDGRLGAVYRSLLATANPLYTSENTWIRSMLFPVEADGHYQRTLNKYEIGLELYDAMLNREQAKAVNTVLNENYGAVPYIISGPPGTGKTKTIVELTLQLLDWNKDSHLVLCAPSDPAADTLVIRLKSQKYFKPSELLRLNGPSRSFPEVPKEILAYCCVDDGMFSLPSFSELMRLKVVVTTCRDAEILLRARTSNTDLCKLQENLHSAIYPGKIMEQPDFHWTGLLMDEAAQASELEALIPLSVVAPPSEYEVKDKSTPIFVMAGDQHQLGLRTASKLSAMQTSLFERLLQRPFYFEHALARSKQNGGIMPILTQSMLDGGILRPAFTNLIRNYRSHPAILATPSLLFYNDTLEPEATNTEDLLSWSRWPQRRWPILFTCNTAEDRTEQDGGGWYNREEAYMACKYAADLLSTGLLLPPEICIMSPFRAQVQLLRRIAREAPFHMPGVNIGPLEAFQGLESRAVILCTTRTRNRFLDQDIAKGLGVIYEPKRFNVAITRAKQGLIVIGNPELLVLDENWRSFLAFCHRNNMIEGAIPETVAEVLKGERSTSRLERQLKRREKMDDLDEFDTVANGIRALGVADNEDMRLWRTGIAAEEEVLRNGDDTFPATFHDLLHE